MTDSNIVNITYRGLSRDLPDVLLHSDASDDDVRRVAAEVLGVLGVMHPNGGALTESDFKHFVVDRFEDRERIYLRPKVPFGSTEMLERHAAVSVVEKDDKVLCVWNMRYQGWSLPGGMMEEGESAEAAQQRELEEETGLLTKSAVKVFVGEHGLPAKPGRANIIHVFIVQTMLIRFMHYRGTRRGVGVCRRRGLRTLEAPHR